MKTKSPFLFLLFLIITLSCNNSQSDENNESNEILADKETVPAEFSEGNIVEPGKTKTIKELYVIDKNGIELKQEPNTNSKTLKTCKYGEKLEIIELGDNWYGIITKITRKAFLNGDTLRNSEWEKVYVDKNKVGELNKIHLIQKDLNVIFGITKNNNTSNYEDGKILNNYLKIELIEKSLFDSEMLKAIDYITYDTLNIKKSNGTIELPCTQKSVRLTDKTSEEDPETFTYIGQVEFLNMFIVKALYWEAVAYKFIDKVSGKTVQSIGNIPYISQNKKYIISLLANPYEMTGDVELYEIADNQIKHIVSLNFKNWMPATNEKLIFWGSDDCLYVAALHIISFWNEDGSQNEDYQYIRIKVI